MKSQHLIDLNDLTKQQWEDIVSLAVEISHAPERYADCCAGKILATLFYEPSTRTQMSFQSAMLRLGGRIIGFDNPMNSSVSKGESLADTIRMVNGYANIIVMRHPVEGAAMAAGLYSDCSLINAGDGGHLHPTQTLTDLTTLQCELGDINGLTIGMCGDLKNGRTVHSLIKALCHYSGIKFVLTSTDSLSLPEHFKALIDRSNCTYVECHSLSKAMPELDVLYMTRIQKERFDSIDQYNEQKDIYVLGMDKLNDAKAELKILHPLPRVDEIALEVDDDPRALYFKQARYGVYARMALMLTLFRINERGVAPTVLKGKLDGVPCRNPNCITNAERYLTPSYIEHEGRYSCEYCDFERK